MSDNPLTSEKAQNFIAKLKGLLIDPGKAWPSIAAEGSGWTDTLIKLALPLAAIGPVCMFLGLVLMGPNMFGMSLTGFYLKMAIAYYVFNVVVLFAIAAAAKFASPPMSGKDDWPAAFKLVAYSMVPYWIAGVLNLIPSLGILPQLLGLYGFYLLFIGATPMLAVPKDKAPAYTGIVAVAALVAMFIGQKLIERFMWQALLGGMMPGGL